MVQNRQVTLLGDSILKGIQVDLGLSLIHI